MKTLVLPARCTPDSVALEKAAHQIGWHTERMRSWSLLDSLHGQDVALYQDFSLGHVVAGAAGVALIAATDNWLSQLPEVYRRRNIQATTIGALPRFTTPLFIKDACEKRLQAGVYKNMQALLREENVFPELPILVAEPVVWETEFRCFVLERQVVTDSPYFRYGNMAQNLADEWFAPPEETEQARHFAWQLLSDLAVPMPPAIVLDVGKISRRGWAVVELNPVWASGIYGCEPRSVLSVLARACIPRDKVTDADRLWILEQKVRDDQ